MKTQRNRPYRSLAQAQYQSELKQQYLASLAELSAGATTLRHVVNRLLEQNIPRKLLITWAVEAGYDEGYVRTLLSKLLCTTGKRQRQPGAGPKPSAEALLLLAIATDTFGDFAEKFLRAAAHAAKAATIAVQSQVPSPLSGLCLTSPPSSIPDSPSPGGAGDSEPASIAQVQIHFQRA